MISKPICPKCERQMILDDVDKDEDDLTYQDNYWICPNEECRCGAIEHIRNSESIETVFFINDIEVTPHMQTDKNSISSGAKKVSLFLMENLSVLHMSRPAYAERIGVPLEELLDVLVGNKPMTIELSRKMAAFDDSSPLFWYRLYYGGK